MKTTRIACLLGAATLVLAHGPAAACGDKLSMMGGGVSFELVNPARHRGNVVLFVTPDSPLRLSKREQTLEKTLRRAGHTVRVANSPAELASAIQAGNVDIVLTDAQEVAPRPIATGPDAPAEAASLALSYRPAASDFSSTSPNHTCVARVDQRGKLVIDAIENVLATKGKVVATSCSPASVTSST
jgi:hypothetical protein